MAVTSKRNPSGIHTILKDGQPVGEAWRWTSGAPGFGLRLKGYYWSRGQPNQRAGFTTTGASRLKDALALAARVLQSQPPTNPERTTMAKKNPTTPRKRGFAAMDPQRQREIASMGGRQAHREGRAHVFTTEEAREAGRKGGLARQSGRAPA